MKKSFLIGLVVLTGIEDKAQTPNSAPYYKNEFNIGIGAPTSIRYGDEAWFDCVAASTSISYFRYLNQHLAVGGSLGFAWGRKGVGEEYVSYTEGNVHYYEQITLDYRYYNSLYLMGGAKWAYINKEFFCMYMRGVIGVQRQHFWYDGPYNLGGPYDINKCKVAGQVTLLGIEGGYKFIHSFFELGYGMEGIMKIGFTYRFGK